MDSARDYIRTIAKQLLSLKSINRMTKQDQQVIENILTDIIPEVLKQLSNVKN